MWGFSAVKCLAAKVGSCVWSGAKAVGRGVVKCAQAVGHVAKKVGAVVYSGYKKVSGMDVAEEAERKLAALREKTRRRKTEFEEQMAELSGKINLAIDAINGCRAELNGSVFPRFRMLMDNFRRVPVGCVLNEKHVRAKARRCAVRGRDELMKIDFVNHPIQTNLAAIFTLGFYTRKMAKESLLQVKEEESRMKAEFRKLDSEVVRVGEVLKGIEQVARYFKNHVSLCNRVLDEVDYSVVMLRNGRAILNGASVDEKFDPEFLPEHHLAALQSAYTAMRIAFAMGARRYVASDSKSLEIVEEDVKAMSKDKASCVEIARRFAA